MSLYQSFKPHISVMGSLGNIETPPLSSRISTVVPATPRLEQNGAHELSSMDLLMKLHYIRAVFFFRSEAVPGLTIGVLKKPMFPVLDLYSQVSGRIRRSEAGRPFIKCNDAGVRISESHCDEKTLEEWFAENGYSGDGLVHDHVLGPDLVFSPLVFVKFTFFKCGGISVGLSWAHVLGDAISAFNFITTWSKLLAGHVPPKSLHLPNPCKPQFPPSFSENSISIRRVSIIGEYWLASQDINVKTHSFYLNSQQLLALNQAPEKSSYFEILSALIWKTLSHVRKESGPKAVTICTHSSERGENEFPINGLVFSKVEADSAVGESDISDLAKLISEKKMAENHIMEKMVEEDDGKEDFIVYGANLTFVDLEEANLYGMELNGRKPILANCSFYGIGDQGVVLVLPAALNDNEDENGNNIGRLITVSLPRKELDMVKEELQREFGIV